MLIAQPEVISVVCPARIQLYHVSPSVRVIVLYIVIIAPFQKYFQFLHKRASFVLCRITIDVLQSQIKERRMGRPVVQLSCLDKTHAERATLLIPQSKFSGHFRSS